MIVESQVLLTRVFMAADTSVIVVRAVEVSVSPGVGLALAQVGFVTSALSVAQVDRPGTSSVGCVPLCLHKDLFEYDIELYLTAEVFLCFFSCFFIFYFQKRLDTKLTVKRQFHM